MIKTKTYLTGRNGSQSLLNLNIKKYLKVNDYFDIMITEDMKYRIDLIAKKYMNTNKYYFFIFWINNIESFDDLDSEKIIKIPKISFIKRVIEELKDERGIKI